MTRVSVISVINEYDKGGLKMTDIDSMVMSLRLRWLKRLLIFGSNDGFWKKVLFTSSRTLWRIFLL